jgi:hypothetical protein
MNVEPLFVENDRFSREERIVAAPAFTFVAEALHRHAIQTVAMRTGDDDGLGFGIGGHSGQSVSGHQEA